MEIYKTLVNLEKESVVTIGMFDGIHKGHQKILKLAKEIANKNNLFLVVITFNNHPDSINNPLNGPKLLTTVEEKVKLLKKEGVDKCILIDFDKKFSHINYYDFINKLVSLIKMKYLIIGYDFRCGYKGEGTVEKLQELGKKFNFFTYILPPLKISEQVVSSTLIRQLLNSSNIQLANELLGHNYFIYSEVIQGKRLASKLLNYPTANIYIPKDKILPCNGVYVCAVTIEDNKYPAIANIGIKPTFGNNDLSLEVHILNFEQSLYGSFIKVEFIKYLRPELKFENIDLLKEQINKDIIYLKDYLVI